MSGDTHHPIAIKCGPCDSFQRNHVRVYGNVVGLKWSRVEYRNPSVDRLKRNHVKAIFLPLSDHLPSPLFSFHSLLSFPITFSIFVGFVALSETSISTITTIYIQYDRSFPRRYCEIKSWIFPSSHAQNLEKGPCTSNFVDRDCTGLRLNPFALDGSVKTFPIIPQSLRDKISRLIRPLFHNS